MRATENKQTKTIGSRTRVSENVNFTFVVLALLFFLRFQHDRAFCNFKASIDFFQLHKIRRLRNFRAFKIEKCSFRNKATLCYLLLFQNGDSEEMPFFHLFLALFVLAEKGKTKDVFHMAEKCFARVFTSRSYLY